MDSSRAQAFRRRLGHAFCGAGVAVAGLVVIVQLLGPRVGLGAIVAIVTPHLLIFALGLAAIGGLLARSKAALVGGLLIAASALALFGDEWFSLPETGDSGTVSIMSWNLELGSEAASQLPSVLATSDADIVALQELTPDAAAAIEADPSLGEAFPHRFLRPDSGVRGMGLLSRFPIEGGLAGADPPIMTAALMLEGGQKVQVLNAHPLPGTIATVSPLRVPIGFEASTRDTALLKVREHADRLVAGGDPVVLAGDMNVAPTEAAYDDLASGLRDAHMESGTGPGWTWRPSRLAVLGAGLLRIDYVFVTPDVHPTSSHQDCSRPGDHCILEVRLRLP